MLSLIIRSVNAQETVEIKKRWGGTVYERYFVLKGNRKVKHGLYEQYNHGIYLEETGMYEHGKRVGRWNFYRAKDTLEQRYNYTTEKLEFSAPASIFDFRIVGELNEGDRVSFPVFVGGKSGFWRLQRLLRYSGGIELFNRYSGGRRFILVYLDRNGEPEKLETLFTRGDKKEVYKHSISSEIRNAIKLVPATVNGKNAESVLIVERFIPSPTIMVRAIR
ncbi:MAG TPA: hypothetical protein VGE26_05280 [Sphingobacteriaceae bacterium]